MTLTAPAALDSGGDGTTPTATGGTTGARRRRPARARRAGAGLGLVVPGLLLLAWQVSTVVGWVSESVLPPPAEVAAAAGRLAGDGELLDHLATSLTRVGLGFGIGAGAALAVGVAVGLSGVADRLLSPTLLAVRAVPSLAWVPLLVLWIGLGETPKVVLVAIGAFFPVLATLVSGIRQVDPGLLEVARAYGLSRSQTVRAVLLPTAAPSLLAGARLGLAQSWLFLVAAELLGASQGLGFLLVDAQNTGRVEVVLVAIVLLAAIGKVTDLALSLVESRVLARLR